MLHIILYRINTIFSLRRGSWINAAKSLWILSGITILVYLPTFTNDFQLGWDDTWQVLGNPLVQEPSLHDIFYHFTHFWQRQFSPVNSLLYYIIFNISGMEASAFHAACLLIHICSTLLVFIIVKKLVVGLLPQAKTSKVNKYAFFTALLFTIHPVQVESVAWISASKIVLYGLFTLAALWSYIRYIQTSNPVWLAATALAYFLAFGSKEQAIVLPLNLLLFDYAFGRFTNLAWRNMFTKKVLLEKTFFFLLAGGFWYFSWVNNLGTINQDEYPFYQRAVFGMYSITEYIFRFLAPVKLYFIHPFPISPSESLPLYYYSYIVLVGIIIYFIWDNFRKGNKLVVFGFLFFLINLLLVLHIIPLPRTVITADRYIYLSIIGLALILVWQLDQWLSSKNQQLLIAVGLAWTFFLGCQTFLRTTDWKNSGTTKANVNEILLRKQKEREQGIFNFIENE